MSPLRWPVVSLLALSCAIRRPSWLLLGAVLGHLAPVLGSGGPVWCHLGSSSETPRARSPSSWAIFVLEGGTFSCSVVLYCLVLCRVVLRCVVLCCVVLFCVVLPRVVYCRNAFGLRILIENHYFVCCVVFPFAHTWSACEHRFLTPQCTAT